MVQLRDVELVQQPCLRLKLRLLRGKLLLLRGGLVLERADLRRLCVELLLLGGEFLLLRINDVFQAVELVAQFGRDNL